MSDFLSEERWKVKVSPAHLAESASPASGEGRGQQPGSGEEVYRCWQLVLQNKEKTKITRSLLSRSTRWWLSLYAETSRAVYVIIVVINKDPHYHCSARYAFLSE